MQKFFLACVVVLIFILFRPVFVNGKTLFPSNLLVSSYAPWKYEPAPEYPNGPPNKPIGFDDARQFFPNRKLLRESFANKIVPLWNPYIYSGTPFMSAFDTSVWYPLSWIAALFSPVDGWNFLVIVQPVLSLVFMYLFLRSMKLDPHISLFGAFVWAFSGFMVVYWQEILVLEHSFLWLPLALYASNEKKHTLLALTLAFSVFGGFLQMSIYVYVIVGAWNIYIKNYRAGIAMFFSLCIAAVQLIPSWEAFRMSPRGVADGARTFAGTLLPFQHLITLFAPDFWGSPATYNYFGGAGFYFEKMIFVGVFPLLVALYGAFERKKKHVIFWGVVAAVSLSLGFAIPTSWLPYWLHIPVLSNSYPTRIFGIWTFAAAVLASFGLSSLLKTPNYKRLFCLLCIFSGVLIAGWVAALSAWCVAHSYPPGALWCTGKTSMLWDLVGHIPAIYKDQSWYSLVSLRNLVVPSLFLFCAWLFVVIRKPSPKYIFLFVCLGTLASGFYFTYKYVYFSERRFVYPALPVTAKLSYLSGYNRVWGYGNAFLEKNIPQYYGWYSTDGYGNLSPLRYAELLSTIVNGGRLGGAIRRSDTDIYEASERDAMTANPYRLRMMSLLGVRYILEAKKGDLKDTRTTDERFPQKMFAPVWQNDSWRIWEYKDALPRAIFASGYIVKKDPQELVDALYNKDTQLATTIVLEEDPGRTLVPASGSATITSYGLNSVTIKTHSTGGGFVLLTDNYYPGWNAWVDGRRERIFRADYAFKAAFVPEGEHTLVFQYAPRSVIIGGVVTVLGIIAALVLL